ncbi:uncharacterized protein KY384_000402 [Bacidia gigantensis]|uniref:uncharacterized protein n=1 Tax=Bacidia gigantensis TaxID=2732470 RepID=UPI001D053E26|nr:uncharacterized protein KY384_000402 [Bacidia gigantensis]KAG8525642.1 hypothetical protein KY384_000402 [Bacidia gigantensis]
MLGRLKMNVEDCLKVYEDLMGTIFGTKAHYLPISASANVHARYDPKRVKQAIEEVLRKHGLPEDCPLHDELDQRCRVFVCCVAKGTTTAERIRSYDQKLHRNISATISQAALATSAATSYFPHVTIGPSEYVDGALLVNNPVTEVESEAQGLWGSDQAELKSLVKCFLSIGTGTPAKKAVADNLFKLAGSMKDIVTDTEATNQKFQDRWRGKLNERRLFRFDVARGLQDIDLADYTKQGTIVELTEEYMDEADAQIKLQACTENLMGKECKCNKPFLRNRCLKWEQCLMSTDNAASARYSLTISRNSHSKIHEKIFAILAKKAQSYTLREVQGSYDLKELRECRAVLRVTNVEKDREDLRAKKGTRVPGTCEWIIKDTLYQEWQGSGPDALWITADPGRGKTMLSLFILEHIERSVGQSINSPDSTVQDQDEKEIDLYYFFCSSEEGSRRSALSVFRNLISQIVSKHQDLMKHVLDYLSNNRPIHHVDNQPENGSRQKSKNEEKKDQPSRAANIQTSTEQRFPAQTKFVKSLLRSAGKPENDSEPHIEAQTHKQSGDRSTNKSRFLHSMLGKTGKVEQGNDDSEDQQETRRGSASGSSVETPERDSPKSRQLELLDVSELSFILRKLIRELPVDKAYFLLDGVDECLEEDHEVLTLTLLKLWDVEPGKFKILFVSRFIGGMGATPTIRLKDTEQTKGDIEKFVARSVEELGYVKGLDTIQGEVEQKLSDGAEGTFLWVSLVIRELKKKKTCTEILDAIRDVPPGLDDMYKDMLRHIEPKHQRNVYQILRWVVAAVRPLTLQELSEVIGTQPSESVSEQSVLDSVTTTEGLLKVSGNEVTLIHSSARDFLVNFDTSNVEALKRAPEEIEALHCEIAQYCYEVILRSNLRRSEIKISERPDTAEPKMLKYAIKYWMEHVKLSNWAEDNFNPNDEFFQKDSKLRKNWWTAHLEDSQNDDPKSFNVASFLHLAAYFGIVPWIKPAFDGKGWISNKATMLMELDHYWRTPLHIAVEQGHGPVVSLLLDQGVNIEKREASLFATPLHLAARNGHKNICEILLEHKAKINARNRFDSTPLTEAARGGHINVVELLVRRGADINGSIDKTRKSLHRQISNLPGYTERALGRIEALEYAERSTPMIEAARQNHAKIIRYLSANGANVEAKTLAGYNALHIAAYHGQVKALDALVDVGALLEAKDDHTHTPLFMASWQNHPDAVRWLLDHQADSEAATSWGFTPLLVASVNGYVEPMKILLGAQAKHEAKDENGYTSLSVAAKNGKVAAVQLLIDSGAEVNTEDNVGNIPLSRAIHENLTDEHIEVIQLLLKHGAKVNHEDKNGLTPLMKAAQLSNGDAASVLQHLLEAGATLDATDKRGQTAFMHGFKWGSNKTQEFLMSKGAVINARDNLGDDALIIAAGFSNPSAVTLLLEHGADIKTRNTLGITPLIKAASCGLYTTVELLLDRGADIAVLDEEGKSAIDHAAARERGNVMKILKARGASRENLRIQDRAFVGLSTVEVYRPVEDCRISEREWENRELNRLATSSLGEESGDQSAKDQSAREEPADLTENSGLSTNVAKEGEL